MPSIHSRRTVLKACGTTLCLGVAGLSGCSEVLSSRELGHTVEVFNTMESTETFAVEVTNRTDETLYRRKFRLRGGYGEEGTEAFGGTPIQIIVTNDRLGTVRRQWPETDCEGSQSAGGVDLYLTAEEVQLGVDCNTQYID
ncbi:MAG: hypothetical protein J07HQW1_02153 [Haloquadratum walsbyi J07HQW1]|uniref:Lipoprotein n=1 Tax=Haloquadratum walsbyi J07HQW1 TaxID=1238424 RepID=U1N6N7_9EURY|nr:MAG: hypothetical protein J07HQW1_02153 [Haloquadratum walsbyi J07HQW1]